MKNIRRWAIACALVLSVHAQAVGFAVENDANSKVDALLSSATHANQPGLAALVSRNGRISFAKSYGLRELRTGAKIDLDTNFRLASFTKQFTAMGIMLLVHDGKLHYESRLTEIFPEFPEYGRTITVRNLLNHTGGLPDYEDLMEKEEKAGKAHWSAVRQIQDSEVLALLKKQSSGKFAAGSSWAYSNSGYVVLGSIVAKVSGMPFEDFLAQRIFSPLQMKHTLAYVKGKNTVADRAYGHSVSDGALRETDQSSTSATLGDGGIYSNLNDLAKWDDALRKHTLLSATEMASALEPVKLANGSEPHWPNESDDSDNLAPGKPVSYGFGWFLDPYESLGRMWHTGSTMGFRTVIERFTQDGFTVIILCNRTDLDPKSLAESIAKIELPSP